MWTAPVISRRQSDEIVDGPFDEVKAALGGVLLEEQLDYTSHSLILPLPRSLDDFIQGIEGHPVPWEMKPHSVVADIEPAVRQEGLLVRTWVHVKYSFERQSTAPPSAAPRCGENQKSPLAFGKAADVYEALRLDAHSLEGRLVSDRGDDEFPGILEADEAPVEQVIDAGRQQ